jgi:hypothetical protein
MVSVPARRAHQFGSAALVDPMPRKDVLGEIDTDEYYSYGLFLPQVS